MHSVSPATLKAWLHDGAEIALLDVREHGQYGEAHPFYADLARLSGSTPKWNFHKYLIGRDGRTVKAYTSFTTPEDGALLRDIRAELARR